MATKHWIVRCLLMMGPNKGSHDFRYGEGPTAPAAALHAYGIATAGMQAKPIKWNDLRVLKRRQALMQAPDMRWHWRKI